MPRLGRTETKAVDMIEEEILEMHEWAKNLAANARAFDANIKLMDRLIDIRCRQFILHGEAWPIVSCDASCQLSMPHQESIDIWPP